ncbi:sensor histidine kinase, partial [Bacillus thuringiensis]|nr:sensor histidine kinase [Bacillus thuringiensis]
IIAIDQNGIITMMNTSAEEMLHVNCDYRQQHIAKVLPEFNMDRVLENDQEIAFQDKLFILNMTPLLDNNSTVVMVCSII